MDWCASCRHDTHGAHAAHATMLLSQTNHAPCPASLNRAAFAHTTLSMGGTGEPNRPVHTCGPLGDALHLARCAHSSSYDEASLKAEEISEGSGTASRRILVTSKLLRAAPTTPPASGDTGIALVTCGLASYPAASERRGEAKGRPRHAADVADVACGPYRRKAPPRSGMLRLRRCVHYLR
jgi:hypothetical protein